jgi:hypothetical protein
MNFFNSGLFSLLPFLCVLRALCGESLILKGFR